MAVDRHKKTGADRPGDEKLAQFLEELTRYGNVSEAAKRAGVSRTWLYHERRDNERFAEAWAEAKKIGDEALEDEARRRAFDGWDEPVLHQGRLQYETDPETGREQQTVVRKYSDTLLIFLLKGSNPSKYKDRVAAEHSGPNGGPIQTESLDLSKLTDEELARLKDLAAKARPE